MSQSTTTSGPSYSPPPSQSPPISDPSPTNDAGEFGPDNVATEALGDIATDNLLTEVWTGGAQLLSTAPDDGVPDPFSTTQGGWSTGPPEINPYTNAILGSTTLNSILGRDINAFTNISASSNLNAFTGGADVEPLSGSGGAQAGSGTGSGSSGSSREQATPQMTPEQLREFLQRQAEIDSHLPGYQPPDQQTTLAPDPRSSAPPASGQSAVPGGSSLPPANPATVPPVKVPTTPGARIDSTASATGSPPQGGDSSGRARNDDPNVRFPVQASLAATTVAQATAHIFAPRDAAGNPLASPLNLYTDVPALGPGYVRGLARAAPGHLISDTKYYGPANAAESAELASRGLPPGARLPPDIYNKIWGRDASAPAVRDAALSGSVATHNDLKTLRADSIQNIYELPALKVFGGGMGAVGIAGGAALIYGGSQQRDPILAAFGITGGVVEVAGGAARVVGSFKVIAPLQQTGRTLGTAGAILTAPLTAHSFYDNLSKGDWFEAIVDATSFGSAGLTVGGAAAGSALLTEGGLVLGAFGIGVAVGTGIDKGLELATKGVLGVDLSPSALIANQLTAVDKALTSLWADPSKPAYTQSIAWKLIELTE